MRSILLYIILLLGCTRPKPLRLSSATTYDNLYTALTNARSGDTIRITGTVDCSGRKPLELRSNSVTVMGGVLRSNTTFDAVTGALLVNYGTSNKFIGTTFQGSDTWANQYDEIWTASHYFTGFLNYGDSTLLKACKFVNCGRNGAWFYRLSGCEVDGCTFTGIMWQGTGYGLWAGSMDGGSIRIHHCIFNRNRVHIDGSGHLTNIQIDSCTFGRQTTFVPVQRHDRSTSRGSGGGSWRLIGCTFLDSIEPCRPTVPVSDTAFITGNTFNWRECGNNVPYGSYFCSKPSDRVVFAHNSYKSAPVQSVVLRDTSTITAVQFALKSSYWQGLSPYTIRVMVDSQVVYRSNASGKLSWKKGWYPVSTTKGSHTLSLSVTVDSTVTDTTRTELMVWVDDLRVTLSKPSRRWTSDPSFESGVFFPNWNQVVTGVWSAGIRSCDSFTGSRCFQIRVPFRSRVNKGESYTLYTGFIL